MGERLKVGVGEEIVAQASGWALAEMLMRISSLAQSTRYAHGLKPSQWTALRYFATAPVAKCTVSAFAQFHATTRGAASQMVDVLVGKGLLVRIPVPEDRRVARLRITAEASALLDKDPLDQFTQIIDGMPPDRRSTLADTLDYLLDALNRQVL